MCNKLANRHVRVGLASPSDVPRCDICENAPGMQVSFFFFFLLYYLFSRLCFVKEIQAFDSHFGKMYVAFFYCEVDGSNLCLQCDMIVHVGGKRTHGRYLLLRQRVEVCNCYTEILESQSCYFYVKFFFETICLFCSFQGINYLVILRSQVRNP
jgi:hypothetical protein